MAYYSPTDRWPNHSKSWFRDVLKAARGLGWNLETNSNHGTFKLSCPGAVTTCQMVIYSTGKSGETVAKNFLLRLRRCRHGVADKLTSAKGLLDKAERLIEAVFTLHDRDQADAQALAAMDVDDCDESHVEELLNHCDQLARQADDLLGEDAKEPTVALAVVNGAMSETRDLLKPLPRRDPDVRTQRERLRKLDLRVAEAREIIAIS